MVSSRVATRGEHESSAGEYLTPDGGSSRSSSCSSSASSAAESCGQSARCRLAARAPVTSRSVRTLLPSRFSKAEPLLSPSLLRFSRDRRETIALSASGTLSGVVASFTPTSILGGGASALTLQAGNGAPPGVQSATISLRHRQRDQHTLTLALTITALPPQDFTLSVTPTTLVVTPGASATALVIASAGAGFVAPIALSIAGLPIGVNALFTPSSMSGVGSSTLTVSAAAVTTPGSYALIVTGSSAGRQHSVALSLTVQTATPTPTAAPSCRQIFAASNVALNANSSSHYVNLETGQTAESASNMDLGWLTPSGGPGFSGENGVTLHDLGMTNLNAISCAQLEGLSYSPVSVPVQNGHVFAAKLIDGDDVKVAITIPAGGLGAPTLQWVIPIAPRLS